MMKSTVKFALLLMGVTTAGTAAAAVGDGVNPASSRESSSQCPPHAGTKATMTAPVKGLPYAGDKGFCSLDEYLAFRQKLGATDRPWYKLVAPGVYQLVKPRVADPEPQHFSRGQLAEQFGFPRES
ncbi:hypothetical protein [Asticcacaulis excentricus]|uniref:hypothetical protein n=1 Tax=Asticcacaulis excentricus TaxID=78587 RepID=UPI000F842E82|nr:hypothetical protein [Asticcacaulis excentricus]